MNFDQDDIDESKANNDHPIHNHFFQETKNEFAIYERIKEDALKQESGVSEKRELELKSREAEWMEMFLKSNDFKEAFKTFKL